MAITTKQIDKLILSGATIAIVGDDNKASYVRFTARDRSYGEYVEIATGHEGKLHRSDITLF